MLNIGELGSKIRSLRQQRGLTAAQLAEQAGLSRTTLYHLEQGRGNIEMSRFLSLCRALGVELDLQPARAMEAIAADVGGREPTALQRRLGERSRAAPAFSSRSSDR